MKLKLNYKKIVLLLTVVLVLLTGFLWYKEQITNKEAPKRANFVINYIEWCSKNG